MKLTKLAMTFLALSIPLISACITAPTEEEGSGRLLGRLGRGTDRVPSATTLLSTARVLASQGRDAECEITLRKLVADHPDVIPAYNELAELYLRNDRTEAAVATLALGLEQEPEDAVLMNNVGMCHLIMKDYETAIQWFDRAAEADAEDARCRANRGFALGMLGQLDEAMACYYAVMSPADTQHNIGVLSQAIGNHQRAEAAFEYSRILREKEESD